MVASPIKPSNKIKQIKQKKQVRQKQKYLHLCIYNQKTMYVHNQKIQLHRSIVYIIYLSHFFIRPIVICTKFCPVRKRNDALLRACKGTKYEHRK